LSGSPTTNGRGRFWRGEVALSGISAPLADYFAAAMDRLGPFEPNPALAVAVSGGADSMGLAVLARDWAGHLGGSVRALIVDHGLRAASPNEAQITVERLERLGIAGRILRLSDLKPGSALAERARILRYQVLANACLDAGILHLLIGHHAADQVETVAMRVLRGSQTHGLAGIPALREIAGVRLIRPLLGVEPSALRHLLIGRAIDWIEDPSNQDLRALRPRLRHARAFAPRGDGGLPDALSSVGELRRREEEEVGAELAQRASIRPEGFALLSPGRISVNALRALVRTIGGARYPPSHTQICQLAARPGPATVAGVRILPAGRLGDGLLIVREEAAISAAVPACHGAIWDGRFRQIARGVVPSGTSIGKLGADAARFRGCSDLPSTVLRTMPALRLGEVLASVPHLRYPRQDSDRLMTLLFAPDKPAAGPSFAPAA
jgi:tRNA(Ile)-lysidine synthase